MKIGMLWLDTDRKRSLDEKVLRAAEYYRDKYGRMPELCLVNRNMIEESMKVGVVRVETDHSILADHFWLGMAQ